MANNSRALPRTMPSGRTGWREFTHKLRGMLDVLQNLAFLYPKTLRVVMVASIVGVPVLAWMLGNDAPNEHMLRGDLQKQAIQAYAAIDSADTLAEHFEDGGAMQQKTYQSAIDQMGILNAMVYDEYKRWPRWMVAERKANDDRAVTVMWYYLDSVGRLPRAIESLAILKMAAHTQEQLYAEGSIQKEDWLSAELKYFDAYSEVSRLKRLASICRDEAQSYTLPDHNPPTNQCVFEHDKKVVVRQ